MNMTATWVANGLSQDLPSGVVMAGAWHGAELAIWRSASGRLAAWNDRCPHRGMRLSHGFVRGETLSCIYHGWVYGTDAACHKIPAHPAMVPPAAIKAEAYACVEAGGVIWVAPKDCAEAVPELAGLQPVRSITVTADMAALARALPDFSAVGAVWRGKVDGIAVTVVVQPRVQGMALHTLCADAGARVAVSRWLEALRRVLEVEGVA